MNILNNSTTKCLQINKTFKKKYTPIDIPKLNNKYFRKIHDNFIHSYIKNHEELNIKNIEIHQLQEIDNEDSYFIAQKFKKKIKDLKYNYHFHYQTIDIYFKTNKKIIKKIPSKIIYIFLLILTLKDLFNRSKAHQKIIFYDLYDKKSLPSKLNDFIDQENCNSAFCSVEYHQHINGPIVLFRNEECLKVIIHELIHGNFIDYNIIHGKGTKEISSQICTKYPILLNEGFTETFASLLHMMFISHITKINIKTVFENEVIHTLYIMNKLLHYYKVNKIEDILVNYGCVKEFKQKTNVFSYYIIKTINYLHINSFLNMMKQNSNKYYQPNEKFNLLFMNYIMTHIKNLNSYIYKDFKYSSKSLRLTCYEIQI